MDIELSPFLVLEFGTVYLITYDSEFSIIGPTSLNVTIKLFSLIINYTTLLPVLYNLGLIAAAPTPSSAVSDSC